MCGAAVFSESKLCVVQVVVDAVGNSVFDYVCKDFNNRVEEGDWAVIINIFGRTLFEEKENSGLENYSGISSSSFHHLFKFFRISSRFPSFICLKTSIGTSSGPGALPFLNFFNIAFSSCIVISFRLYPRFSVMIFLCFGFPHTQHSSFLSTCTSAHGHIHWSGIFPGFSE